MFEKYLTSGYKKKVRGTRRKFNRMEQFFKEDTNIFPSKDEEFWHLHLPCSSSFIDSKSTTVAIRRKTIQLILDQVEHLINVRPNNDSRKVFATINTPSLFNACINLQDLEDLKNSSFIINYDGHKWTPLDKKRDLIKEWGLSLPENLQILGRKEVITEDDYHYEGEVWFIGELDESVGLIWQLGELIKE